MTSINDVESEQRNYCTFGGARALLMHAAQSLIAAGARQTSFYQRDPLKRLIRTLSLQNSVTLKQRSRRKCPQDK